MSDLLPLARDLRDTAALIVRLADIADETRTDLPLGYSAGRDRDGISRPVEAILIAHEERGVTAAFNAARAAITSATVLAESAARHLDEGVRRWEGVTDGHVNDAAAR